MVPLRALAFASLWLVLGCEAPSAPRRPGSTEAPADKAALFGDPSLVPTRQGEHARREVALAQEIERAIEVLPSVDEARVDVELPPAAAQPRVLAVVRGTPHADQSSSTSRIVTIAHTVIGSQAAVEVVMETSRAAPRVDEPSRWPLVLAVLGLGFFSGMLLERARRLRRPSGTRRGR